MPRRLQIGDVFTVRLSSKHIKLMQYTHDDPDHGNVVRVLKGIFHSVPQDIASIVGDDSDHTLFLLLRAATQDDRVRFAGHFLVPRHALAFPVFRYYLSLSRSSHDDKWYTYDGASRIFVGRLNAEQRKLPLGWINNLEALIKLLEEERALVQTPV